MISAVLFFAPFDFRLKEIQMSEYDATTYEKFSGAVRRQVHSLRIILDNLQVIPHLWIQKVIWARKIIIQSLISQSENIDQCQDVCIKLGVTHGFLSWVLQGKSFGLPFPPVQEAVIWPAALKDILLPASAHISPVSIPPPLEIHKRNSLPRNPTSVID